MKIIKICVSPPPEKNQSLSACFVRITFDLNHHDDQTRLLFGVVSMNPIANNRLSWNEAINGLIGTTDHNNHAMRKKPNMNASKELSR